MRVVSLVPSWTETLLAAGVLVVGRTRYCVHPKSQIPAVAGTKNWNWTAIKALKPDLLVLDREENPKFMSEQNEIPVLVTHVTSVQSMPGELKKLNERLEQPALMQFAERWQRVADGSGLPRWQPGREIPGLIDWGVRPEIPIRCVLYMIWRNPWMSVSKSTFIGSMLERCGVGPFLREFEVKYPIIDLNSYVPAETLLLFSSEPYPFLRKRQVINPIGFSYAFVNGEAFSWFGVRSLNFLENLLSMDAHKLTNPP